MEFKDFIRICVLRSNAHWPFSILNRTPYFVAIGTVSSFCKRFQEIRAVYVRHRLAGRGWIPALSDIDLTIVISKDLGLEREYLCLQRFWRGMQWIQKVFPMIGEIEILNEDQLRIWLKYGTEGRNFKDWQLISGNPVSPVPADFTNADHHGLRAYNFALSFYLYTFYRKLHQATLPQYLLRQDSFRILRKIHKSLGAIGVPVKISSDQINERVPDRDEMICLLLAALENGLNAIAGHANRIAGKTTGNGRDQLAGMDVFDPSQCSKSIIDIAALARWKHLIRSVYQTHDERVYVILKDGIDFSAMGHCVRAILDAWFSGNGSPTIIGEKLFEHLLQHYYPFEYAHLAEFRILLLGADILPNITPPGKSCFVDYLIGQVPLMIAFPFSFEVLMPRRSDYYLGEGFEFTSQNMLFLKCYLEKGIINAKRRKLLADCLRHSPHHLKRTRMLQMNLEHRRADQLSWEWFKLLRPITDSICRHLSNHSELNKAGSLNE
jgi:hypothetical protein